MFLKIALSTKYYLHNECEGLAEVLVGEVPGQRDGAGGGADGGEVCALLLQGEAVLYCTVLHCNDCTVPAARRGCTPARR